MTQHIVGALVDAPINIGRDEARDLAERELTQRVYADAQPSWWERASTWVWEQFNELLGKASGAVSGVGWLVLLALVVAVIIIVIAVRTGRIERQRKAASTDVFSGHVMTAAEHRDLADRAASEGRWDVAVRESFRSLVRRMEERGTLETRAGRTADEAAREAGRHFPALAAELRSSADSFDEVAYGDRPGTADAYQQICAVDESLRSGAAAARS